MATEVEMQEKRVLEAARAWGRLKTFRVTVNKNDGCLEYQGSNTKDLEAVFLANLGEEVQRWLVLMTLAPHEQRAQAESAKP
jgi:hypothetical protein